MSELPVYPVAGARWAACAAGIKAASPDSDPPPDLALLELAPGSRVAAVFTQNAFCAAPVTVAGRHLRELHASTTTSPIYCLINAGNANAGTGELGLRAAESSCQFVAAAAGCEASAVLPFSTGVIGELLPVEKIEPEVAALLAGLEADGWQAAARAIMTTDTVPKVASRQLSVGGTSVTVTGIAKGAGMIKPNMATMLAYLVTDAELPQPELDKLLQGAVNSSFNRITVDGDTSTNDACVFAATGQSGVALASDSAGWSEFENTVQQLMQELACAIIRDAEGASKFITLDVVGGGNTKECLSVAYAVAESPLVKTAFFASDANWGRILAAVGRAGISNLDVSRVRLLLDDYCICEKGGRAEGYDEQRASHIMAQPEIVIRIELGRGSVSERVWTSDLSHDYVRINAEYRT